MMYISVFIALEKDNKSWRRNSVCPGGTIVIIDDDGDAVSYNYTRKKFLEICKSYYMHPECVVLADPYIVGIAKHEERYAHQELGFIMGCASSNGMRYKVLFKKTYYKYFGLLPTAITSAYSYCLANYPKLSMLYKFKDELEADRFCSAYLMSRFMEAKRVIHETWKSDLKHIVEELDDAVEECDLK